MRRCICCIASFFLHLLMVGGILALVGLMRLCILVKSLAGLLRLRFAGFAFRRFCRGLLCLRFAFVSDFLVIFFALCLLLASRCFVLVIFFALSLIFLSRCFVLVQSLGDLLCLFVRMARCFSAIMRFISTFFSLCLIMEFIVFIRRRVGLSTF